MRCFGQHQYLAVGLLLALLPPKILFTLDCNGNGKDDNLDIQVGTSADCNKNGIPDDCDVRPSEISFLPPKDYPFVKGVGIAFPSLLT